MRKSAEFDLDPKPLSGMARYSPGRRPSMIEEKPWTGCEGSGKVTPFTTPGGSRFPLVGPGAYVCAGSTALPSRRTALWPVAAVPWSPVDNTATAAALIAMMIALRWYMVMLRSVVVGVCRARACAARVPDRAVASVPISARDRFVPSGPCARDPRRGGCARENRLAARGS